MLFVSSCARYELTYFGCLSSTLC